MSPPSFLIRFTGLRDRETEREGERESGYDHVYPVPPSDLSVFVEACLSVLCSAQLSSEAHAVSQLDCCIFTPGSQGFHDIFSSFNLESDTIAPVRKLVAHRMFRHFPNILRCQK